MCILGDIRNNEDHNLPETDLSVAISICMWGSRDLNHIVETLKEHYNTKRTAPGEHLTLGQKLKHFIYCTILGFFILVADYCSQTKRCSKTREFPLNVDNRVNTS